MKITYASKFEKGVARYSFLICGRHVRYAQFTVADFYITRLLENEFNDPNYNLYISSCCTTFLVDKENKTMYKLSKEESYENEYTKLLKEICSYGNA